MPRTTEWTAGLVTETAKPNRRATAEIPAAPAKPAKQTKKSKQRDDKRKAEGAISVWERPTRVAMAGFSLGGAGVVLYGMIARQPVSKLWFAGLVPGLIMAGLFILYVLIRAKLNPKLAPTVDSSA